MRYYCKSHSFCYQPFGSYCGGYRRGRIPKEEGELGAICRPGGLCLHPVRYELLEEKVSGSINWGIQMTPFKRLSEIQGCRTSTGIQ